MWISLFFFLLFVVPRDLHSFPTRRSSDLDVAIVVGDQGPGDGLGGGGRAGEGDPRDPDVLHQLLAHVAPPGGEDQGVRSEEHTSELQSQSNLVCRLLLEKKKKTKKHET